MGRLIYPAQLFMKEPRYKLSDLLIDTSVAGSCYIVDMFYSRYSDTWVYRVKPKDSDSLLLYDEDELC